jgi:hypothetical protein
MRLKRFTPNPTRWNLARKAGDELIEQGHKLKNAVLKAVKSLNADPRV